MNEPLMPNDLDTKHNVTTNLAGALPPSEANDAAGTIKDPPSLKLPMKGFKDWGPWKRWSFYREFQERERKHGRAQDVQENACGRLPDEEGVQLPGIWAVELYTPSTVGGLFKGIEELGWEYGRSRNDSLTKWMNDVRGGRQAGWISLGLVSPPNAAHLMRERSAELPSKSTAAFPVLMSLTPSITAFIILFLFDEEAAVSLEASLRTNFTTTTRRTSVFRTRHLIRYVLTGKDSVRFGFTIRNPDNQRREAVKSQLQALESDCIKWVRRHFPGAFDSLSEARLPTAALFVTEQVRPMSDEARALRALEGLALDRNYDAWESVEWPGARLGLPRNWDGEGKRLTFGCRRHDAFPHSSGYHDPMSNWTIAQRADDFVQGLLSRWALTCLLDGYHETLSAMRDEIACDGSYQTVRDLKKLRSFTRTLIYDISACTREIEEFTQSKLRYRDNTIDMTYIQDGHAEKYQLLKSFSSSQEKRARQVRREAELLQTTLSASNNLSQTITNIRIQHLIILLTVISIGIALWSGLRS